MNWRGGLVGLVCCLLMMGLHIGTGEFPHTRPVNGEVGTPGRLYESTVTVNSFTTGQDLYEGRVAKGRTPVIYLMVSVTVATTGREQRPGWKVGGISGDRTFSPRTTLFVPQPGFRRTQDVVFELDAADLEGFAITFLDQGLIYVFDNQLVIDLGITAERAAELTRRGRDATVRATTGYSEVIR